MEQNVLVPGAHEMLWNAALETASRLLLFDHPPVVDQTLLASIAPQSEAE